MKPMGWVVKNAALDVWEAKRAIASRLARWTAALAGMAGVGLACGALWGVAEFPNPSMEARAGLSYARVAGCEAALAGVEEDLRLSWMGPGQADVKVGCRREGGEEFIERWAGAKWSGEEREGALAALMSARGMGSLARMEWEPARARWSGRGFAEALGLAEPTRASRGWLGSSSAADWGVGQVGARVALGWASALGLVMWAAGWAGEFGWALLMALALLGWCAWAGWVLGGKGRKGARMAAWSAALGAGLMALAGAPVAGGAAMLLDLQMGGRQEQATRWVGLADCEEKARVARRVSGVWLGCREEGGRMGLIATMDKKWSDEEASTLASKALGERVELGAARMSSEGGSWRAFKEVSGWEPATEASRPWAFFSPRWRESGGWSWSRFEVALSRSAGGFVGLLVALGLAGLLGWVAWDGAARALAWARERRESLGADPEFLARAERRELERDLRSGGAGGKARGERL